MKKILIIYGGKSYEHEISCMSADNMCNCLKKINCIFDKIYISKENKWYLIKDNNKVELLNVVEFLKKYDLIFPVMHGASGEDGKLQAFLELFDINYIGSKSVSSMISMNKYLTKVVMEKNNIKQIPYIILNQCKIPSKINYPVIVKPANGGSSIGISIAHSKKELKNSLKLAFKYDQNVIVEKFIKGREFECGIVKSDKIIIGNIGEIKHNHEFYDFEAKYNDKTEIIIPAKIDKNFSSRIKNYAKEIFQILELDDFARIDFIYEPENDTLYFNEVNTIPGFTNSSMFPLMFANFPRIIEKILENKKV